MQDRLKEYWLEAHYNDSPDAKAIDFSIADAEDNVCWVWGNAPDDVEVECDHPNQCIEYDDDEPCGRCELCGATCTCHYEVDEGNVGDYYWKGRVLVPTEWTIPDQPSGIIGEYLEGLKK